MGELKKLLAEQAAVAIVGPRQVGKTTLAREVAEGLPGSLYLDLEAREDRERLTETKLFLGQYESVLVVLDEIHKVPELFASLRGSASGAAVCSECGGGGVPGGWGDVGDWVGRIDAAAWRDGTVIPLGKA